MYFRSSFRIVFLALPFIRLPPPPARRRPSPTAITALLSVSTHQGEGPPFPCSESVGGSAGASPPRPHSATTATPHPVGGGGECSQGIQLVGVFVGTSLSPTLSPGTQQVLAGRRGSLRVPQLPRVGAGDPWDREVPGSTPPPLAGTYLPSLSVQNL